MEKEIIHLLKRISSQLEEVSAIQHEIMNEINRLYKSLFDMQENTLKDLEERLSKATLNHLLN